MNKVLVKKVSGKDLGRMLLKNKSHEIGKYAFFGAELLLFEGKNTLVLVDDPNCPQVGTIQINMEEKEIIKNDCIKTGVINGCYECSQFIKKYTGLREV